MIKHILRTHQGDKLEFDIHLQEVPEVAPRVREPRELYAGETVFFETDSDPSGNKISITQDDLHFVIDEVLLTPGQYPFRAGLNLSDGTRQIVFDSDESVLVVRRD